MSFTNRIRSQKGFTLIELLITVVILAILAAVVYSTLAPNKDTAKASKAIATAQDTFAQAQTYASTNGNYSSFSSANLTGQLSTTALPSTTALGATGVDEKKAYIATYTPSGGVAGDGIVICSYANKVAFYCIKDSGAQTLYKRFAYVSGSAVTLATTIGTDGANITGTEWVN
jgi:type IV pilus assembly protein PilE